MQQPGRLIILNGVSSSGKTTLATGFRDQRADDGELWLLMGIDDYLSKLPAQWLDLGLAGGRGRWASDGLSFVHTPSGTALRVGSVCRAILRAYQGSVGAAVRSDRCQQQSCSHPCELYLRLHFNCFRLCRTQIRNGDGDILFLGHRFHRNNHPGEA